MNGNHINISERNDNFSRYLIINADDFGYYDCVSKGIIAAVDRGTVTATGIFPNSPFLETHLPWLNQFDSLDTGVHLNLTNRFPLTDAMRKRLYKWNGCFPGKFIMVGLILMDRISLDLVEEEIRAQIEHCLASNIKVTFLNSHEHIHMLPPVYRITQILAIEYDIPHIRYALPDAINSLAPGSLLRDISLRMLGKNNRKFLNSPVIPFLGMSAGGRLSLTYLRKTLSGMSPGVYELMCHPGACDKEEVPDPAIRKYHDWKGEFDTLTGKGFRELCIQENIKLIGYRHLKVKNGRFEVQIET